MIIQNLSDDGKSTDITFTVPQAELARAEDVIRKAQVEIGCKEVKTDLNVVKVSVIGIGMRSHSGVAKTMFQTLGEKGINILAITTSEIKVSVLIASEYTELAVRALHTAYGLDGE
jgi:aspartate kinase